MKTEIKQLRELVGNKIFSVVFQKKDGTLREMVCRLGVKKHLKGGELGYDAEALNYLTVFDMQSEEYRTVNLNTLKKIKLDGVTYDIE
jgi:hypothetical protein